MIQKDLSHPNDPMSINIKVPNVCTIGYKACYQKKPIIGLSNKNKLFMNNTHRLKPLKSM